MTPLTRVGERVYALWRVPCLMHCICGGFAEFVFRAEDGEPAERYRRRRCRACSAAARAEKRKLKAIARRERDREAFERGRLSAKREHARRQRHRRKRLQSVPATLRSEIKPHVKGIES